MKFQMNFKGMFLLIAIVLLASLTLAGNITKPYTFAPDTPASSAQVNADFDALYNKINELSAKNDELSAKVTALESSAGKLPPADYDSGWFDVAAGNSYEKQIGFTGLPKLVTAYYKLANGQIFSWGLNSESFTNSSGSRYQAGIVLDFNENGSLYVRTPSGNSYNYLFYLNWLRNRTNNGNESLGATSGQFRVLLWK